MSLRYGILAWAALATALVGCHGGKSPVGTSAPQPALQVAKTGATMPDAYWKEFQRALRARDAEKVADMTHFPADIGLAVISQFVGINQRKGFIRHFDTIFPKEAAETLLATKASDLEFESSDDVGTTGGYWFVAHNHKDSIASEHEWTIGYIFTRQADGSVKLTKVDFAG